MCVKGGGLLRVLRVLRGLTLPRAIQTLDIRAAWDQWLTARSSAGLITTTNFGRAAPVSAAYVLWMRFEALSEPR